MAGHGKSAVFTALVGNGFLVIIKSVAFLLSGSPAILSEAIHSLADTANQFLLWVGIRRSRRPADARYHWGYGGERYLFALMSAVGIFVLGCGVTVYHGVESLVDPPDVEISWISFAVLGTSMLIEGYVLVRAAREVNALRGQTPFWTFVRQTSDPTILAVLFEDAIATVGVLIAMAGIGLAHVTGESYFDAGSSIVIGLMLGGIAVWLGVRNRELILGPAIPKHVEREAIAFLLKQPSVEGIRRVRTRIVASDRFAFAAEVDYDGRYLGKLQAEWVAEQLGEVTPDTAEAFAEAFGARLLASLALEIDRLEGELRKRFPRLVHVDLESDETQTSPEALAQLEALPPDDGPGAA